MSNTLVLLIVAFLTILTHEYVAGAVNTLSPPNTVIENERRYKIHLCQQLAEEQQGLPEKYQPLYNEIQELCGSSTSNSDDILRHLGDNLTDDEITEIHLYSLGKLTFCDATLDQLTLQRHADGVTEEAENIPEFVRLQNLCRDPASTLEELIPLAMELNKIYS